ncbi:unnamed protein product [Oikopleura dioica]|uniref:Uncharacterized protein n=1 Tax=Oikopleura dioica TaxID=34765 RepID=E4Z4Q1_OIKDI|nr:unnamed protein product [Oikopleura dioica]
MQENAGEGDYTVTSLFLEEDGENYILGNPKLYIFGTVASGVIFGVVVGLTMIIFKHKKTAKVQREEFKNFEQIQSISKILAGCRPGGATFGRWTLKRPDYQKT